MPKKGRVFGRPLAEVIKDDKTEVPIFVSKCMSFIRRHGMQVEGIFRLSGNADDVKELQSKFDKEGSSAEFADNTTDAVSVAALMKQFFRKLPEPLFTFAVYDSLVSLGRDDLAMRRGDSLKPVIEALPKEHRDVLAALIPFLAEVATHESANKMKARALAVVWAPNLLRAQDESDLTRLATESGACNNVVQNLISFAHVLFPDPNASVPNSHRSHTTVSPRVESARSFHHESPRSQPASARSEVPTSAQNRLVDEIENPATRQALYAILERPGETAALASLVDTLKDYDATVSNLGGKQGDRASRLAEKQRDTEEPWEEERQALLGQIQTMREDFSAERQRWLTEKGELIRDWIHRIDSFAENVHALKSSRRAER